MKKTIVLIIGILISSLAFSQDCNIGNEDTTEFTNQTGFYLQDYLLGIKFTLDEEGTLHSINLIGKNTGAQVQMAVYDDNSGVPNNLVASTSTAIVGQGIISIPVTPTQLSPGDYWVMAIYDITDLHAYKDTDEVGNVIYYKSLNFGDPIPTNASDFLTYSGETFAYFLEISCDISGVNNLELNKQISIYPNPSSESISISNKKEDNYVLEIIDILGNKIKSININSANTKIDISDLSKGTYLILIDNIFAKKIVVQ